MTWQKFAPRGASSGAAIYSGVETARENGLDPFVYQTYLFERLPNIDKGDMSELEKLLPWDVTAQSISALRRKLIAE